MLLLFVIKIINIVIADIDVELYNLLNNVATGKLSYPKNLIIFYDGYFYEIFKFLIF